MEAYSISRLLVHADGLEGEKICSRANALVKRGCDGESVGVYVGAAALFPMLHGTVRAWSFPVGLNTVRLVWRGENVRSGEYFHVTASSHGITLRLK